MLRGVDVAVYEPVVDWYKVRQAGYKFAFVKATQNIKDPMFDEHWKNTKAAGFPRGAYHFYDPRFHSPKDQAELFFTTLGNDLGELPFVIDLEAYTSGLYYGSRFWYDYLEHLKSLSNHPIMIYTSPSYWEENVLRNPAVSVSDINYFKQYKLWIANYRVSIPYVPAPWKD